MPVFAYIIVAVAAYLLGSIPTGYLVAKAKGIDIQKSGSGNIGATNAMRVLGKPAGIFVMVVDAAKGYGAVYFGSLIVKYLMDHRSTASPGSHDEFIALENAAQFLPIIAGICAVLGHNYPCWLKFKGGKGIATTAGVYLAFAPVALLIALAVFILTILVTRYVSVGSIAAAIVLPVAVWFNCGNLFFESVTIALSLLAIYKHKSNIKRLMAGTESRFGKKPEDAK